MAVDVARYLDAHSSNGSGSLSLYCFPTSSFIVFGLNASDVPQQLLIGLVVGIAMAAFAATYRMLIVGPWFRWPHQRPLVSGCSTCSSMDQSKSFFFRGFMLAVCNTMDRRILVGMACEYGGIYTVSSTRQMELVQCWWCRTRQPRV